MAHFLNRRDNPHCTIPSEVGSVFHGDAVIVHEVTGNGLVTISFPDGLYPERQVLVCDTMVTYDGNPRLFDYQKKVIAQLLKEDAAAS